MSAESIARWNAIPLNRPDPDESTQPSLKRTRPDGDGDDDESEDNVSLVSRSPSPPPPDAMEIDKYDEYYTRKPAREVVTVETKIKSNNIGFSMLAKMGWVEGSPLGISGEGRVDPIPFYVKNDLTGLGKTNQDVRMIETTVSQRRELDSERMVKETEEQRRQREEAVARRAAVQSEISTVLRPFYCEVCEKQFQNVAQYDEHTNSYAHHHKIRFRDMQAAQRASRNTEEEINRRKEKERKREEKELRKIAKAAGIKMTKPPVAFAPVTEPLPGGTAGETQSSGVKKSGWAKISTPATPVMAPPAVVEPSKSSASANFGGAPAPSGSGSGRAGWATVNTPTPPSAPAPPPASAPPPPPPSSDPAPAPPSRVNYSTAPAFRTGGWTSLDTNGPVPPPPPIPAQEAPAPPPPVTPAPPPPNSIGFGGGWSTGGSSSSSTGWQTSVSTVAQQPPPSSATFMHTNPVTPVAPSKKLPAQPQPEVSRSGWQKFRAGAPGRRR